VGDGLFCRGPDIKSKLDNKKKSTKRNQPILMTSQDVMNFIGNVEPFWLRNIHESVNTNGSETLRETPSLSSSSPSTPLSYIDGVIVINLDRRTDRREHIATQLMKLDVNPRKVFRLSASEGGCAGCLKSHTRALVFAMKKQWKNVLILEDDFEFDTTLSMNEILSRMNEFHITHQHDYGFVQLASLISHAVKITPTLSYVLSATNAAGYVVNERIIPYLIQVFIPGIEPLAKTNQHWIWQNDVLWNKVRSVFPTYAFTPPLGTQYLNYSDLSNMVIKK